MAGLPVFHEGIKTLTSFRRVWTQGVMKGNVIAPSQFSQYIRGRMGLECNGHTKLPGHLRDFDIEPFVSNNLINQTVMKAVLEHTDGDESVCLYAFYRAKRNGAYAAGKERKMVGWVLTTGYHGQPDRQDRHLAHWPAKFTGSYVATIRWIAERFGYDPGASEREKVNQVEDEQLRQKAEAAFEANADEETLAMLK